MIFHNNKRLVEVWLDKYKDFVYAIMPGEFRPRLTEAIEAFDGV